MRPVGIVLGWLLVDAAWSALLSWRFAALNGLDAGSAAALFGFWLAVYAPLAALGSATACVWLALRRGGGSADAWLQVSAWGAAALLVALNFAARWVPAYRAFTPPARAKLLPVGALDLATLALFFAAVVVGAALRTRPDRRGRGAAVIAAAVALLAAVHGVNRLYERPTWVDLETAVAPHVAPGACDPQPAPAAGLALLAIDGMTWSVVAPLLAQGRMPHLQRLLARSSYGHLDPLYPSYSPVVWASIATGLPEDEHGVHGWLQMRIPGVEQPIARGPLLNSFVWWGASNKLLDWIASRGWIASEPVRSDARRGMALWNVAAAHGHEVGVYDWMTTWPVERVRGYMLTHGGGESGRVFPAASVASALERAAPDPDPEARNPFLATYQHHYRDAFELFRAFEPSVSMHFNKVLDESHDRWTERYFTRPLPSPPTAFAPIVEEAYEITDRWIGRFADALPDGYALALVSDHGYEFDGTHHAFSPPGVLILSGGPFACGERIEGADILDVAPTLLATLGLPGTEAMPGRVLDRAFPPGRVPALERRNSYPPDWRTALDSVQQEDEDWQALRDRLRALGYDR